jgi:hypothetical protein
MGGLVLSSMSSCFVGSFDKVQSFSTGGGGSGTGGGGGAAGSGGSQPGGSGGDGTCEESRCDASEGEDGCCFSDPLVGDVCGRSVDDYPVRDACLPLNSLGRKEMCAPITVGARTLEGCCLTELGMCGAEDPEHPDLGCVAGEALGAQYQSCGTPSCGTLCQEALVNDCMTLDGSLPLYQCALICNSHSTDCAGQLSAAADCDGAFVACSAGGFALVEGCEVQQAALERCWGDE